MLVNQVMNIVLLCLYLFCENHFILFVSVLWILFYYVCTCSALLLSCFHVVSRQWKGETTTFWLSSGSTISKKDPDDHLVIQPVLLLLYNLP